MAYEAPKELLEILVDPEKRGPVRLATESELSGLRQAVTSGRAKRRDGKAASESFEAAFLCQQGAVAYVVEDGIPIFLIDERLDIDPPLELEKPIATAAGSAP
jgi:uncharacterized protein YbaR (Trm112 family)